MPIYILDENMPCSVPLFLNEDFVHVLSIWDNSSDSDIWDYALENELTIVTKDVDFYNRYLSSSNSPKIIWFRTGNIKKQDFYKFIGRIWIEVEIMILSASFIIVTEDKLEVL